MRIREDDALGEPEFSMAPLIDVVFQLLIFFMVATNYNSEERQIGIELPKAESSHTPAAAPEEIVINVFRDGRISLGGHDIALGELRSELERTGRAHPEVPVTIRGDRLVHHEDVISVMDACGLAGLSNLAVGTLDR